MRGMRPRRAPGQVQLALSEMRVAALRLEQAENEIDSQVAQIQSQMERIELVTGVQKERLEVLSTACAEQLKIVDRTEALANRRKRVGLAFNLGAAIAGAMAKGGSPAGLINVAGDILQHVW